MFWNLDKKHDRLVAALNGIVVQFEIPPTPGAVKERISRGLTRMTRIKTKDFF
jgi:hypothetical protein